TVSTPGAPSSPRTSGQSVSRIIALPSQTRPKETAGTWSSPWSSLRFVTLESRTVVGVLSSNMEGAPVGRGRTLRSRRLAVRGILVPAALRTSAPGDEGGEGLGRRRLGGRRRRTHLGVTHLGNDAQREQAFQVALRSDARGRRERDGLGLRLGANQALDARIGRRDDVQARDEGDRHGCHFSL